MSDPSSEAGGVPLNLHRVEDCTGVWRRDPLPSFHTLALPPVWTCNGCGATVDHEDRETRSAALRENEIGWRAEALSKSGKAWLNVSIPRRKAA